MIVLVTGGAGFIGSHLCDALLERGHRVLCVDDLSFGSSNNIAHHLDDRQFRFIHGSTDDLSTMLDSLAGHRLDAVVHCASKKIPRYGGAREMLLSNARGAEVAFEVARLHDAKIVFASTADVYGRGTDLPFSEESPLTLGSSMSSRWGYAASKIYGEHLALAYAAEFGLRVTIVRFFGAYGPRQHLSWWGGPHGVFLVALARGKPLEIHGSGQQTRSFIFIADLVEATIRALEDSAADGQIINIARNEELSILELAYRMAAVAGVREPRLSFIPYSSFPGRYEDVSRRTADTTKLQTLLGFVAHTELNEGLVHLWEWYCATADGESSLVTLATP